MDRRRFVQTIALAFIVGPARLRRAFADAALPADAANAPTIAEALARARARGRPLFVIVIPERAVDKATRGDAWGAYLNTATDAQLAPLAGCDLACATRAELHAIDPRLPLREPDDSLAVVLDPRAPGPHSWIGGLDLGDAANRDALVDHHVEQIALAVRAIAESAHRTDEPIAAVRARARARIPGAPWAVHSECGPDVVDGDDPRARFDGYCGLGHVPERARRFLYFFSRAKGSSRTG